MDEALPLLIIIFSALEKVMSYSLLRSYPLHYEELNPVAIFMTQKVGPAKTYIVLFLLSILLVSVTYEYCIFFLSLGTLCLVGELMLFVGAFINSCVWRLFKNPSWIMISCDLYYQFVRFFWIWRIVFNSSRATLIHDGIKRYSQA